MVSLDLSDEDFLESLGISLDGVNVTADADTHASVTGVYAQAVPSRPSGPSRAPRAISKATGPLHPGLANLRLPYNISYHTPDGTLAFREVSLENVDRLDLPLEDINEKGSITQVWLEDHLQVVAAPTFLPYNPSQYRMRRILITHPSTDAWTSWLIELGPNEVLWYIS
ncbi:hypothetical protein JCGZ_26620 [Jatropha curcas]|uniref:Uncharacterized protein n=1 Tax=Jatropha curcas TaxID=180498 RepID=A0A067JXL5_JATCU|nr:hypothetical protein JCGZ_26620 [Jatropha curcas]